MREAAAAPLSSSCPSFQHHLALASLPPRLFSSPSGGPLFLAFCGGKAALVSRSRGADRLFSFCLCGFFWTDSPGRTAAKGLDEPPL